MAETKKDGVVEVEESQQMKVKYMENNVLYEIVIKFDEKNPKDAMVLIEHKNIPFAAVQAAVHAFTDKHADLLEL